MARYCTFYHINNKRWRGAFCLVPCLLAEALQSAVLGNLRQLDVRVTDAVALVVLLEACQIPAAARHLAHQQPAGVIIVAAVFTTIVLTASRPSCAAVAAC